MRKYAEINIKVGMPTVEEAMTDLRTRLASLRREKCGCVLIIHGYGSTGKGGAIGRRVRKYLLSEKQNGKIKNVIFGEDLNIFNFEALAMKNRYKELEPLFHVCNNGVTAVEL